MLFFMSACVISNASNRPLFISGSDIKVALWNYSAFGKKDAPALIGMIDGQMVAAFIQQGPTRKFLELRAIESYDCSRKLGTANLVVGSKGEPKLMVAMGKKLFWSDVKEGYSVEFLEQLGLNVKEMNEKQLDHDRYMSYFFALCP